MTTRKTARRKPSSTEADDYELKLDEQVISFLGLNYNLTFFIITAAVGSLGFTLSLLLSNKLFIASDRRHLILIISISVISLSAAWLALLALTKDIRSFQLHLKYRHERKTNSQLSGDEMKEWDSINNTARRARRFSRRLLVLSVAIQVFTLVFLFTQKGETAMHHYGEDSTEVRASEWSYDIEFLNKETGQKITMHVPRLGVKSNPSESPTLQEMQDLASEVAHLLRQKLD